VGNLLAVLRNRNLALLLSGRAISLLGDAMYQIALSVAIYHYSGNSSYVGVLWFLFLVPILILGPVGGAIADRLGHRRAMIIADLGRLVVVALLAITLRPSTWALAYPPEPV
jgi:MFS family permease